jgi:hypothetical protein
VFTNTHGPRYWYHGESYHVVGDRADITNDNKREEWSWLSSEGGTIDDSRIPMDRIKELGRAALEAVVDAAPLDERLPKRFEHEPSSRVDFGCCLDRTHPK